MRRIKDLTGQRFGKLVAVEPISKDDPRYGVPSINGSAHWLCRCDCGKEIVTRADRLTYGTAKSCGCARYENRRYPRMAARKLGRQGADLVGKRFGHLTVICKAPKEFRPSYTAVWLCLCDCGNETYCSTTNLTHGHTKTCGKECEFHHLIRKGEAL